MVGGRERPERRPAVPLVAAAKLGTAPCIPTARSKEEKKVIINIKK